MEIHHSPQWYRNHCRTENCNPPLRKQLKEDCRYIGADPDNNLCHLERITNYENQWKEVMGKPWMYGCLISQMGEVIIREYSKEIDRYNREVSRMVH